MDNARADELGRQPIRRRRAALSCIECRRKKIKCNRIQPCEHCNAARAQCIFRGFHGKTTAQTAPEQVGSVSRRQSLHAPSPVIHSLPAETISNPHGQQPSSASGITRHRFSSYRAPNDANSVNHVYRARMPLDGTHSERGGGATTAPDPLDGLSLTGWDILKQQSGLQDSDILLKKTRLLRWSDWISMVNEFSVIGDCYSRACGKEPSALTDDPEYLALIAEMATLLTHYKSLAKYGKNNQPTREISLSQSTLELPSRERANAMAIKYFHSFESIFRILHAPSFWRDYEHYWTDPQHAPHHLQLTVLLVISIGSSIHESQDRQFRKLAGQWVHAAQIWLSGPLEKDRFSVNGIQIHCLTILARQLLSMGGDLTWTSMGSLIHMAMQIGLHRDPRHLPSTTILQAEIRRRLWATILELTAQTSLDSAMPPRISMDEFDTAAPANVNDDELTDTALLVSHPRHTYTSTSMQLLLLDSLPLRLHTLRSLTSLKCTLSYPDILTLDKEITEACRVTSKFAKDNEHNGVTTFHRNLLEHCMRRFLLPLHAPFASITRQNPLFHYSLKVSIETSLAIISPEPDKDYANLMAVGSAFLGEAHRCAGSIVAAELIAQTEMQQRDGVLHRSPSERQRLKGAIQALTGLCLEHIRKHVTNIKGHMFMSMVLAQVNAVERNESSAIAVARSAKESLHMCYESLQSRIGDQSLQEEGAVGLATPWSNSDEELFNFDLVDLDMDFIDWS